MPFGIRELGSIEKCFGCTSGLWPRVQPSISRYYLILVSQMASEDKLFVPSHDCFLDQAV